MDKIIFKFISAFKKANIKIVMTIMFTIVFTNAKYWAATILQLKKINFLFKVYHNSMTGARLGISFVEINFMLGKCEVPSCLDMPFF